jgi:hypothetical protein
VHDFHVLPKTATEAMKELKELLCGGLG